MGQATRNAVYNALTELFQQLNPTSATPPGNGVLATPFADRFTTASQVQIQPWACLMVVSEDPTYPLYNGPPKREFNYQLVIYSDYGKDPSLVPAIELNNLLDQFAGIMRPGHSEQTLGGLVQWVRFGGHTTVYTGDMLDQGITVAAITALATR
jgi:hypothetical protein